MLQKTLKTILGAVGFCAVTAVHAAYPERPITLVVSQIHHLEFAGLKVYKIGKGIQKT